MSILMRFCKPEPTLDVAFVPAVNRFMAGRQGTLTIVLPTEVYYQGEGITARFWLRDGHANGYLLEGRRLASLQWRGTFWQSQSRMLNLDDLAWYRLRVDGRAS